MSSIKHRIRPPSPAGTAGTGAILRDISDSNIGGKRDTDDRKLHGKLATRCAGYSASNIIIFAFVIMGAILTIILYMNKQQKPLIQKISDPPKNNGLRKFDMSQITVAMDRISPFSTLSSVDDHSPTYALKPLIGTYSLKKEDDDGVTGTIESPTVDLSTLLQEEAVTGLVFQQTSLGVDTSLLNDPTFKSAIIDDRKQHHTADHALVTRCGFKMGKIPNQDRSLIANFQNSGNNDDPKKSSLLMGIFDGHGGDGHKVSHFIALNFLKVFIKKCKEKDEIQKALIDTFLEIDKNEPVKGMGGSTASVIYYPGNGSKVYVANAGDSTTLIAAYSKKTRKSTIIYQNRKHKPHVTDERQRIEASGGQVMIPPSLLQGGGAQEGQIKESSRLIIPSADGNPFGGLALAMSRSIGDFDGKKVGLIASPEVDVWDASGRAQDTADVVQYFAVSASDGVYDVIDPEIVADYLGKSLFEEGSMPPLEACERLIREASRLWMKASGLGMQYRDDITVGVSTINIATS